MYAISKLGSAFNVLLLLGTVLWIAGCGKNEPVQHAPPSTNSEGPPVKPAETAPAIPEPKVSPAERLLLDQVDIYEKLAIIHESVTSLDELNEQKQTITNLNGKLVQLRKEFDALPAEIKQAAIKATEHDFGEIKPRYAKARQKSAKLYKK